MPQANSPGPARRNIVVLGMLSTFGPISLDLYLPALPQLAAELETSTSAAQLTLTACLIGLAVGQIVAGPMSDRFGRKRPLMIGLIAYALASLACAFAWSISVLLVLRLIQGLAGAAGIVIARAVARDLHEGRALVIFFSRLVLVSGLAPVIAPVLGGQLNRVMTWRGIFVVLAVIGVVLVLAGWLGLKESLPPEKRIVGGLTATLRGFGLLIRDRFFVGVALAAGLVGASMFSYIAGATFVLQKIYGLSPQGFSLAFGINSLGILGSAQLSARLTRRFSPLRVLAAGLAVNLTGALCLATAVLLGLSLPFVLVSLFVMVSAIGMVLPTSTALALANYPERAGTASALLGLLQYLVGGLAAPLVGLGGEDTAVPLGVVAASASLGASVVFAALVVPPILARRRTAKLRSAPEPPPTPAT
ncbi:MAG TPA: multidrug effflux MFS transporter [Propionibacteriaceae bacterium]|nr:multidrug effflux MFS transporter [Propionibacteriaceae bacterium]